MFKVAENQAAFCPVNWYLMLCLYIRMYVCMWCVRCLFARVCMYVCLIICIYARMLICMYVRTYVCVCACVDSSTYVIPELEFYMHFCDFLREKMLQSLMRKTTKF